MRDDGKQEVRCVGEVREGEEHDYFSERVLKKKEMVREELDLNLTDTELRLGPPATAITKDAKWKDLQLGCCISPSKIPKAFQQQHHQASSSKTLPASGGEISDAQALTHNSPKEEAIVSPTRAPVGWPPVPSFRKNGLPSSHSKSVTEREDMPAVGNLAAVVAAKPINSYPLFVKVYMDGLGIGRKVDLKIHNSYDKLSAILEEMFHKFLNATHKAAGQNLAFKDLTHFEGKRLNFLCGSEYVIAYEDKDGDLMLMGDVPWEMFEETVKRLRIMKGYEAIGLAPRSPDKTKNSCDTKWFQKPMMHLSLLHVYREFQCTL